jgi:hypothetical protein
MDDAASKVYLHLHLSRIGPSGLFDSGLTLNFRASLTDGRPIARPLVIHDITVCTIMCRHPCPERD